MENLTKTSCIIPFYNEGERLFHVLDVVTKIKNLDEIICVDDASREDQSDLLKKRFPKVKLITLKKNLGKTGAIRKGLEQVRNENIILLDADLRNLRVDELEQSIDVFSFSKMDMLILRRVKAPFIIRFFRGDVLVTGERLMKKSDLTALLDSNIQRFQLESALNEYIYSRKKSVYWFPFSGINTHKPLKMDLLSALKHDFYTFKDIFSGAGFFTYIKHMLFFAREKYE